MYTDVQNSGELHAWEHSEIDYGARYRYNIFSSKICTTKNVV